METTKGQPAGRLDPSPRDRLTALKAVTNFGAPVEVFDSEEADVFQGKLDETTGLLSTRSPPNRTRLLGPSCREMHLDEQVTNNLTEPAQQVTPGDIVSVNGDKTQWGSQFLPPSRGTTSQI
ncbi:Bromodomain-containing protein 7 [Fukomys damarensis]|uniref:Bromodomain-containing protein 7 n=1 Tax=Fukomys damarensis TaxID=885580 RepID=A0A091DVK2_FUKDA|nr:Bromodomain-containing protein 7 [Fukomys damarensis]